jgi:imidazolonepropionase-like amidohydrolase
MLRALTLTAWAFAATASALFLYLVWGPPRLSVPPQGIELSGLTLVAPGESRRPGQTVRVEGGTIVEISATASPTASSAYSGMHALPGLVDLHVHHPPVAAWGERELFALLFLRHGVTSVRDVGSFVGGVLTLRRRVQEGDLPGPRIFACGPIVDGEPPGWPGARVARDPEEARAVVAALAEEGHDCVKVYNHLSFQAFMALREEADRRGLPIVAHLPDEVPLDALRGVELQHLMGLGAEVSWDATVRDYAEQSRRFRLEHTPTLVAFARGAELQDYASLRDDPAAQLLPRHYREMLWNPDSNPLLAWLEPAGFGELPDRYQRMLQAVAWLHAQGVPVLPGTDTMNPFVVPGASLHEELGHLAAAGISLPEVFDIATRRAGERLGIEGLGVLRPGAPADFVVFRDDPTRDLRALETLEAVVADGRLYPREALDEAIRRQLEFFDGPVYSTTYRAAARVLIAVVHAWDEG